MMSLVRNGLNLEPRPVTRLIEHISMAQEILGARAYFCRL